MAPTIAARVVQYRLFYRMHGQQIENGLYYEFANAPTPAFLRFALDDLLLEWATGVMPVLGDGLELVGGAAMSLDSATAPSIEVTLNPTEPGGIGSPCLPGNCALVVKFSTEARGRSARGRIYVPGLTEGGTNGNEVSGPVGTNIVNAVETALANHAGSIAATHVVISRTTNPATVRPVTSVSLTDLFVDSQRRRLTKRGV